MKHLFYNQLLAAALLVFFFATITSAKIVLPSVFSDNMVLQQNSEAAIWGWAGAGENVKIVAGWNTADTLTAKAGNDAKWTANLKTVAAGGPYSIQIFGSSNVELKNMMLGEVWICSGQSNMEWSVNLGIQNGEEEAAKANHPDIRIFHIPKIGAVYPQQSCNANWAVCSPETMRSTSAVGYFFARELQQKLNVPVGIIVAAWGGTPAEVWIEKSRIENNEELYKNRYTEKYDWLPVPTRNLLLLQQKLMGKPSWFLQRKSQTRWQSGFVSTILQCLMFSAVKDCRLLLSAQIIGKYFLEVLFYLISF